MRLLENIKCLVDLSKQLDVIPPWITTCTRIDDGACIPYNIPLLIADNKPPILFLDKVRDMDDAATPLLLEDLFICLAPFNRCQNSVSRGNHLGVHQIFCLYSFA